SEQDRHGVIMAGVAIQNYFFHGYGSENDRSRPRRRRSFTWGSAAWAPSDVVAAAPAALANFMAPSVGRPLARPTASAPTNASPGSRSPGSSRWAGAALRITRAPTRRAAWIA